LSWQRLNKFAAHPFDNSDDSCRMTEMRFLGIGDSCDLGSLYRRLIGDGHAVRVHVGNALCRGTLVWPSFNLVIQHKD